MLSGQNIIWRNLQKRGILHLITELCPAGAESNYFFSSCMKWQKLWNHLISWSCVCVKSTSLGSNTICSSGVKCKLYYTSSLWTFQNSFGSSKFGCWGFQYERDLSNAMASAHRSLYKTDSRRTIALHRFQMHFWDPQLIELSI